MDYRNLNDIFNFNPTSKNIAKWVVDNVPYCFKVIARETFVMCECVHFCISCHGINRKNSSVLLFINQENLIIIRRVNY